MKSRKVKTPYPLNSFLDERLEELKKLHYELNGGDRRLNRLKRRCQFLSDDTIRQAILEDCTDRDIYDMDDEARAHLAMDIEEDEVISLCEE